MAALVSVAIDPPVGGIPAGDARSFDAIGTYDDATTRELGPYEVTFTTSNPTVATVVNTDTNWGLVHAHAPGSITLTATATTGPAGTAAITVTDFPEDATPRNRFSLAFGFGTLAAYPDWTAIDDHPNLVTSYTIDRGRDYELDQFDTSTATVTITDPDGILDPTNPTGPYHGQLRPLLRAAISRRNPITGVWRYRYRGWVDDYSYEIDPSQHVSRLVISLVDLFEICSSVEMQPGAFGTTTTGDGDIRFPVARADLRIKDVLRDLGAPDNFSELIPGSATLAKTVYSPGESALTVIQEAADGEFPGVANVYTDRVGHLCFHGRKGRFDPEGVSAAVGDKVWNYHTWKAGDGAAVADSPTDTAQVRVLNYSLGVSKIINSAVALPLGAPDSKINAQRVSDRTSTKVYGVRAWSSTSLLTRAGDLDRTHPTNALSETQRFARFFVHNYKQPRRRISEITFRSLEPEDPRAAANWALLCLIDIGDTIEVTVAAPGGGGFTSEAYFVEGIREEAKPGTPEYDDVTVTLDLSPRSYYDYDPWATPLPAADETFTPTHSSRSGHPKPTVHAGDHSYGSADPIGVHYEDVGAPVETDPDPGGGVDLSSYIHYGLNSGHYLQVQTDDPVGGVKLYNTGGGIGLEVITAGAAATTLKVSHGSPGTGGSAEFVVDGDGVTATVGGTTFTIGPYGVNVNTPIFIDTDRVWTDGYHPGV